MALYCIGDLQGCDDALERLLADMGFSPSCDTVYLLGDLVNRGPRSLEVLRRCLRHDGALRPVLGNHDLHLLAAAHGARKPSRRDTLASVLEAPDRDMLLGWLRQQPLLRLHTHGGQRLVLAHAGLWPGWTPEQASALAEEVQQVLRGPQLPGFLQQMYGNAPARWDEGLEGPDRWRFVVNAFTRMRFCAADGTLDFESSESAADAPAGLMPWFSVPGRAAAGTLVAFGHWSTLGWLSRPDLLGLDTGCVWGGCLTAVRFGATLDERERLQVRCEQAQDPHA
ncbi:MAG: symmetrical bis(5'-nucleosyl)-tetraphosphatase [Burkholderiaceae bacterium]